MYCRLEYSVNWTLADAISDIVAVLTGQTNKATLSASLNQTNSFIDVTHELAGWTLWDDISATEKILRSVVSDDVTNYKYLHIVSSNVAQIIALTYSSWNNTTHVGTDQSQISVYINAENSTSNTMAIVLHSGAKFVSGFSHYGNLLSVYYPWLYCEHTRKSPFDTTANGYIPAALMSLDATMDSGAVCGYWNKTYNSTTGLDVTGANSGGYINTSLGDNYGRNLFSLLGSDSSTSRIPDANKVPNHALIPFGICNPSTRHFGGDMSANCNQFITTYNYGAYGDTVVYGGVTYVVWQFGSSNLGRLAVRRG